MSKITNYPNNTVWNSIIHIEKDFNVKYIYLYRKRLNYIFSKITKYPNNNENKLQTVLYTSRNDFAVIELKTNRRNSITRLKLGTGEGEGEGECQSWSDWRSRCWENALPRVINLAKSSKLDIRDNSVRGARSVR